MKNDQDCHIGFVQIMKWLSLQWRSVTLTDNQHRVFEDRFLVLAAVSPDLIQKISTAKVEQAWKKVVKNQSSKNNAQYMEHQWANRSFFYRVAHFMQAPWVICQLEPGLRVTGQRITGSMILTWSGRVMHGSGCKTRTVGGLWSSLGFNSCFL